jgi:hypothetical protein
VAAAAAPMAVQRRAAATPPWWEVAAAAVADETSRLLMDEDRPEIRVARKVLFHYFRNISKKIYFFNSPISM